jgi:hypothetical protein
MYILLHYCILHFCCNLTGTTHTVASSHTLSRTKYIFKNTRTLSPSHPFLYEPLLSSTETTVTTPKPTISESDFIATISTLISKPPIPMNPPLFIFKKCPRAASHNARILEGHNFDLNKIIKDQHPSQLSYGSEFRSSRDLKKLLEDHPLWRKITRHFRQWCILSSTPNGRERQTTRSGLPLISWEP